MTRYLIDTTAFEDAPLLYQAALRERGDCTAYALLDLSTITPVEVNAYADAEGLPVLTTPDRAYLWEPALQALEPDGWERWCVEQVARQLGTPVTRTKARELVKKGLRHVAESTSKYAALADAAFDAALQRRMPSQWEPEWQPWEATNRSRPDRDYHLLDTTGVRRLLGNWERFGTPPMVALDFETVGAYPFMTPVGFSLSEEAGSAWYIPLAHAEGENVDPSVARDLLELVVAGPWVAHNAKFEWHCLLNLCVDPPEVPDDTMTLAWMAGLPRGLKTLAKEHLGEEMQTYEEVTRGKQSIAEVSLARVTDYACADADMSLRLLDHPDFAAWRSTDLYQQIDKPLMPVLAAMERRGLALDPAWFADWEVRLASDLESLRDAVLLCAGIDPIESTLNLNSDADVQWLLFTHLDLDPQRRTQKGYSTDEATIRILMEQSPHPVLAALLSYRETVKLLGTYARGLPQRAIGGAIHGSFDGTGTKSGRLSSKEPNMQNVPAEARKGFTARPGMKLVAADYGQIELRVLAEVSGDAALRSAFLRRESPHDATLRAVFGKEDKHAFPEEYKLSKNVNFLIPYGGEADKLAEMARKGGISLPITEARDILGRHRQEYPKVWEWIAQTKAHLMAHGWVDSLQGHRAWYPDVYSPDPAVRNEALRQGVNKVIQGSAGYFGKEAMAAWGQRGYQQHWPLVLNIHDELVVEAPDEEAEHALGILTEVMVEAAQRWLPNVPVSVEGKIGDRWSELK